jgi:hypothetical protein
MFLFKVVFTAVIIGCLVINPVLATEIDQAQNQEQPKKHKGISEKIKSFAKLYNFLMSMDPDDELDNFIYHAGRHKKTMPDPIAQQINPSDDPGEVLPRESNEAPVELFLNLIKVFRNDEPKTIDGRRVSYIGKDKIDGGIYAATLGEGEDPNVAANFQTYRWDNMNGEWKRFLHFGASIGSGYSLLTCDHPRCRLHLKPVD